MNLSIGKKIALLVFVTVGLSASHVGYWVYTQSNALLVEHELNALGQDVQLRGAKVAATVHALRQDVLFLSKTSPVLGIIRAQGAGGLDPIDGSSEDLWRTRLSVIFTEMLRAKPHYFRARFIGTDDAGRELVDVRRVGKNIIRTPEDSLQAKGHRGYFWEAVQLPEKDIFLSHINLNREHGVVEVPHLPVLRAATPVYDSAGKVIGVIIVNMDFGPALDSLTSHVQGGQVAYVTNEFGDFLAHPDPDQTFGFDRGESHVIQSTYPTLAKFFAYGNRQQEFSSLIKKSTGDEVVRVLKVSFDPQHPERFLGLGMAGSAQAVLSSSYVLLKGSLFQTLLAIGLASALGFVVSRRLVRPIKKMKDAMERMARGEYDVSLPEGATDEVGQLGQAMKVMADRVRRRTDELTQEVAVRKDVEQRLLERDAQIQGILSTAADGIITIDEQGRIETFNLAAQQIFGYTFEEVGGGNVSRLMPSPDREQHDGYLHQYLDTGKKKILGKRREVLGLRKDGTTFPMDLGVSEVRLGTHRVFTGIIRDLTDAKKGEAERETLNKQLAASYRQAGMAEVATGVLHNVGNILNSVSVSAGLIRKLGLESSAGKLQRTAAMLSEHHSDVGEFLAHDPKGKMIPEYLTELGDHMAQEQSTLVKEAQELTANIEHINQVIQMQQTIAKSSGGHQERVDLQDVMEQALYINIASLERHSVEVTREYADIPPITTDRHQVLQILVNLISNAKYAVLAQPGEHGRLVLKIGWADDHEDQVRIEVQDNGVGIKPEHVTRVFSQGFTTKQEGHGFGLHSAVLSAKNMGGSLTVHSDGENQGATFTLTLPTKRREVAVG